MTNIRRLAFVEEAEPIAELVLAEDAPFRAVGKYSARLVVVVNPRKGVDFVLTRASPDRDGLRDVHRRFVSTIRYDHAIPGTAPGVPYVAVAAHPDQHRSPI